MCIGAHAQNPRNFEARAGMKGSRPLAFYPGCGYHVCNDSPLGCGSVGLPETKVFIRSDAWPSEVFCPTGFSLVGGRSVCKIQDTTSLANKRIQFWWGDLRTRVVPVATPTNDNSIPHTVVHYWLSISNPTQNHSGKLLLCLQQSILS